MATLPEDRLSILEASLERGSAGHLLAELLSLFDEGSPWLGAIVRRAGDPKLVEAVERRRRLSSFLAEVLAAPRETWREALAGNEEHHGPILVILVANAALRRLPGRARESLELVRAARVCTGEGGLEGLDEEIGLLLDAAKGVSRSLLGNELVPGCDPEKTIGAVTQSLEKLQVSPHPELVADTWWLVAVARRLAGKLESAGAALEQAVGWAGVIQDGLRSAQLHLERGFVLELAGRFEDACEADRQALCELGSVGGATPLRARAVLQTAIHLVDAGHWDEAERLVDGCEDLTRASHAGAALEVRGRIAGHRRKYGEAERALKAAGRQAACDGDVPAQGLALVERIRLFDESGQWSGRREAVERLETVLMACAHAPPEMVVAVVEMGEVADGERMSSSVVLSLRRQLREWQARECTDVAMRVM